MTTVELLAFARSFVERVTLEHALDTWHGDLRPDSVLWDGMEATELLDPPARPHEPDLEVDDAHALARLGYLAPEQCGGGDATPRSDVFAIGTILYEAATGTHPFDDRTADEIVANIESYDPRPPGSLRPELPLEWDGILANCMHKSSDERYASALDLQRPLAALATSGGTKRKVLRIRWGRVAMVAAIAITVGTVLWAILWR